MSLIVLRGRGCNIIFLNVYATSEEKGDDSKDICCDDLEQVFGNFPRHHMKILLGDFNAKVEKEDIFNSTIGNESLQQNNNFNNVRMVNITTSNILALRAECYRTEDFMSTPGPLLTGRLTSRFIAY